jgi:copper chaperone
MIEFHLPAVSCGHCVRAVTEAVQEVDAQAKVEVDLPARQARIESSAEPARLAQALAEAGYPPG